MSEDPHRPIELAIAVVVCVASLPTALLGAYMFLTTSDVGEWGGMFRFLGAFAFIVGLPTAAASFLVFWKRRIGTLFLGLGLLGWASGFALTHLFAFALVLLVASGYMLYRFATSLSRPYER